MAREAPNKYADWINQHLWQIAAAVGYVSSGYLISETTTSSRLDLVEARLAASAARDKLDQQFDICVQRRFDTLTPSGPVQPPCTLEVPQ